MTGSGFRKAALSSCIAFAALAPFGVSMVWPSPSSAQLPGMGGIDLSALTGSANKGNTAMDMLKGGADPGQLAGALSSMPGVGTTPNAGSDLTSMLTNLKSNNTSNAAGSDLLNKYMTGQMTGATGNALSSIPGLGQLAGQSGAQQFMDAIQQQVGQMPGNAAGVNNFTQMMAEAFQNGETGNGMAAALGQQGMDKIAEELLKDNPALAAAFESMKAGGGGTGAGTIASVSEALKDLTEAAGASDVVAAATKIAAAAMSAAAGGAGGASAAAGGGGKNTEGEKYELNNKECLKCPDKSTACACPKQAVQIPEHHFDIRDTTKKEFEKHREWLVNTFWLKHMLPALMMMAEQLSVAGIQQIEMIGTLLDAKHQLETQRLMQQLMAQAHKDYQPSEGMCTFGTTTKSLAASSRKSDLAQAGVAARMMQRQTISGDVLSVHGKDSDIRSRVKHFIDTYCDKADNGNGLETLCKDSETEAARMNIDVDYTRNIESRLTLEVDLTPPKPMEPSGNDPDSRQEANDANAAAQEAANPTKDEEDLFALASNLYSHDIVDPLQPEQLAASDGRVRLGASQLYLDLRSIFAKRSVAQNSFAAITSMRSEGDTESAPYTKALLKELGISDTAEIEKILGKKPSYFAQMEVLTKKIYQNPTFYTELYDKPVNVDRKGAAIQAIGLMQDRDLYNSLLRSEAVLSVLLETMLMKEQEKIENERAKLNPGGSQ